MLDTSKVRLPRGHLIGLHNAKTTKGEALGWLTGIMYLAPHILSGRNVCPASSPSCRADCLFTSGRGALPTTRDARLTRTRLYFEAREAFMQKLALEIAALEALATEHGMRLAIRLNGTSDILWERARITGHFAAPSLMHAFPRVRFYDYTKLHPDNRSRNRAGNYDLTFSAEAHTIDRALEALERGWNIAAVVQPETHARLLEGAQRAQANMRFHDATAHDLRFLDPPASIGLLVPKGKLRKQTPQTSTLILSEQAATHLGFAAHRRLQRVSRFEFRGLTHAEA